MPEFAFKKLPFTEAIGFFRDKVNLPTETWRDLQGGMHSRAFVIAGAQKNQLLEDIRSAVDKALADGTTLAEFRKSFDKTVQKHGWSYNGGKKWRTAVIYDTNLRSAYSAGNWAQSQKTLQSRPYLRYIAGLSENPRKSHLVWNGKILPAGHPWWATHYPPNGWGCKCKVVSVSKREMERDGLKVSKAPTPANDTTGIDESFDYNPGQSAWGRKVSQKIMSGWKQSGGEFESLTVGDAASSGRPLAIPIDKTNARVDRDIPENVNAMNKRLTEILDGAEKNFSFESGGFRYDLNVNAETLAEHIDPNRARFIPLLPEALENPFEVWQSFERGPATGKVVLRQRIIKAVDDGKGKGMLIVANAIEGRMEAWTLMPISDLKYLNRQRRGKLIYGR